MDPKLAEIYGTNQTTEADLEKMAAAELATKLAGDENAEEQAEEEAEMTEEDLEAIAQQVLAPAEEEQAEVEEPAQDEDAEALEKVSEADYLGRVMAHAYVQELNNIEKTAAGAVGTFLSKAKGKAGKVLSAADKGLQSIGRKVGGKAMGVDSETMHALSPRAQRALGAGVVGTGAAAAGGVGLGAKKLFGGKKDKGGKTKKSEAEMSAVDTLVLARAQEILEASGIDPASLAQAEEPEQEKVSAADPREVLAATVEQRAWEFLGQYGVVPAEQDEQ